jgi:hypothetical protein
VSENQVVKHAAIAFRDIEIPPRSAVPFEEGPDLVVQFSDMILPTRSSEKASRRQRNHQRGENEFSHSDVP